MPKTATAVAVTVVGACAAILTTAAVAASGGTSVNVILTLSGGTESFTATGLPDCATGTAVDLTASGKTNGKTSRFTGTRDFVCDSGSANFDLHFDTRTTACVPTYSGTWSVVTATGGLAGMTGKGDISGTFTGDPASCPGEPIIESYSGTVKGI